MFKDNEEFVNQVKNELFKDIIYVYMSSDGNKKGIPKGSNIIDLACYLDIEKILVGAKVNGEIVPLNYILKNNDRVVPIVDDLSYGYRDSWVDMANTGYAKKKMKP